MATKQGKKTQKSRKASPQKGKLSYDKAIALLNCGDANFAEFGGAKGIDFAKLCEFLRENKDARFVVLNAPFMRRPPTPTA